MADPANTSGGDATSRPPTAPLPQLVMELRDMVIAATGRGRRT
jgi:hypothetical protein